MDYPTEEQLEEIENYAGSVTGLWALVEAAWSQAYGKYERNTDGNGSTVHTLATGGWSGNEDVISALERTMARALFWDSSRRGGHHEYVVPTRYANWELPALELPREHVEYGFREYHADDVVAFETACADQDDAIKAVDRTEYHRAELVTRTVTDWRPAQTTHDADNSQQSAELAQREALERDSRLGTAFTDLAVQVDLEGLATEIFELSHDPGRIASVAQARITAQSWVDTYLTDQSSPHAHHD